MGSGLGSMLGGWGWGFGLRVKLDCWVVDWGELGVASEGPGGIGWVGLFVV